jgi:hypothetical protein
MHGNLESYFLDEKLKKLLQTSEQVVLLRSALNRQDGLTFLESAEIVIERVSNTSGRQSEVHMLRNGAN